MFFCDKGFRGKRKGNSQQVRFEQGFEPDLSALTDNLTCNY